MTRCPRAHAWNDAPCAVIMSRSDGPRVASTNPCGPDSNKRDNSWDAWMEGRRVFGIAAGSRARRDTRAGGHGERAPATSGTDGERPDDRDEKGNVSAGQPHDHAGRRGHVANVKRAHKLVFWAGKEIPAGRRPSCKARWERHGARSPGPLFAAAHATTPSSLADQVWPSTSSSAGRSPRGRFQ